MIRLNNTKRRQNVNRRRDSSNKNSTNANNTVVDTTLSGLVGNNNNNNNNNNVDNNDEGTHNDMYIEGEVTHDTNLGTSSKVNRLFEELLGDNASALGSVVDKKSKGGGGEDSTAMSSVLGPVLRGGGATNNNGGGGNGNANNNLAHIPEEKKKNVWNINSNNNATLHQLSKHRQQQQTQSQAQEEMTIGDDADTYMTKPREITFDQNDDDVSALFGGHCGGASIMAGGVESYMGTFAAQRKNRARNTNKKKDGTNNRGGGGALGNMFGYAPSRDKQRRNNARNNIEEDSRRTGGTLSTFESHGVNSILEEIGLRPTSHKKRGSFTLEEEEQTGGGYTEYDLEVEEELKYNQRGRHDRRGRGIRGGGRSRREHETFFEQVRNIKGKHWIMGLIGVMFVAIQFTTVQKRDRKTMQALKWNRFNPNRYNAASSSSSNSGGLSDGLRSIAMENVEGNNPNANNNYNNNNNNNNNNGGGGSLQMRRRGNYDEQDGLGDVFRKTVPLLPQQKSGKNENKVWEQDGIMMDDGIGGFGGGPNNNNGNNNNLRGNNGFDEVNRREEQALIQQNKELESRKVKLEQELRQKQQQQQQQAKQQEQRQQQQTQQNNNQQQQQLGDTHPLLQPKQGLSMEDALTKLSPNNNQNNNNGGDKLSDIDPKPQQQLLSNDIIPKRFAVFADLKTPYVPGRDTPYFWHIPRSGGVVVKTMLSHCLGQVLSAEVGELDGHKDDTELKVISFSEHNYTNVNIATPEGISRALNLGLVPSHLSDTLVSAHVDLIPSLFNANDRARAFVLFRHPVDRAASMFYFLKGTGYPPLKNMTVDDYAKSELIENNWLVRILSESMTGPIDMDNLEIAKEVLRRKFIIGLLDNKRGSFARFDHYFKWKDSPSYEKEFGCRKQLMDEKYVSRHPIRKDSDTWKLLLEQNRFDVHLYDFAKELFQQQSYIFGL